MSSGQNDHPINDPPIEEDDIGNGLLVLQPHAVI